MRMKPRDPEPPASVRKRAGGAPGLSPKQPPSPPPVGAATAAWTALVAIPVLLLYVATLHPGLPAGDSGELITVAATAGVAHPPGYPLWTMLAGAFLKSLPAGNVAWRLNLFSALCMAAASGVLAIAVTRLSRSLASGVVAALVFATATVTWRYALVAEVFALHALLASGVLLALTLRPARGVTLLAFLGALTLSHHHTLLLLALPAWGLMFVRAVKQAPEPRRPATAARQLGVSVLAALVGLLPLLWIPFATRHQGALVWGDATTWRGFLTILTRAEYGTFQLAAAGRGDGVSGTYHFLGEFLRSLPVSFGGAAVLLAGLGALSLARRQRALALALVMFALLQQWFFTRIGFQPDDLVLRGVVERFELLPVLVLAFAAGLGASELERLARGQVARLVVIASLLVVVLVPVVPRMRAVSERGNRLVDSYGRVLLAGLPANAVFFTRGDVEHNALEYLTRVQHLRADVTLVDQELMSYPWYVRQLRAREPDLLPDLQRASRITLADGRRFEGVALTRGDGITDLVVQGDLTPIALEASVAAVQGPDDGLDRPEAARSFAELLARQGVAAVPAVLIASVQPAASESLYATTRAGFRGGSLLETGDDRYSGFPGSRNRLWADHLAGRRPVVLSADKELSYALRYAARASGRARWLQPRGSAADPESMLVRALVVVMAADSTVYFRDYPLTSFEYGLRAGFAHDVERAALLMCQPFAASVVTSHRDAHARVLAFARRYEDLPLARGDMREAGAGPFADGSALRAIGLLRVFDPAFRDTAQARRDIERALGTQSDPGRDTEAQAVLRAISLGRFPATGPLR